MLVATHTNSSDEEISEEKQEEKTSNKIKEQKNKVTLATSRFSDFPTVPC